MREENEQQGESSLSQLLNTVIEKLSNISPPEQGEFISTLQQMVSERYEREINALNTRAKEVSEDYQIFKQTIKNNEN